MVATDRATPRNPAAAAALAALGARFDADPIDVFHGEDILFCRDLHERGHKVGYTTTAGFCDHIRVTSLEPIVGLVGLLMSQRKEQDA